MFTGIVQFIYSILLDNNILYLYADPEFLQIVTTGDSVAINGVCLTVVEITDKYCTFQLSEETLFKTNFLTNKNNKANVELSLKYGDFLGGHLMTGHVHQIGTFMVLSDNGDMWIDLHRDTKTLTSYKGSVAINGVSLTVAEIQGSNIRIALIPETLKRTNLSLLHPGDKVNVEFDLKTEKATLVKDHSYYMRLAIKEGEKGRVTAPPNPWVGCVIVKNDSVISSGYHEKAGLPHAEVNAIKSSSINVEGSTLYVTLEPCCHYGRTPPCTDLLIREKVKTVVVGVLDPDIRVSGNGIRKLREANIEVILIQDINMQVYDEVKYSLRQYLYQRKTGIPYLTAKIALSMDNCYRNADGISKWITHSESRKEGHKLRSECQAIIVGANTYRQDKPELTVRYGIPVNKQPLKVVIDGQTLIPSSMDDNTVIMTNSNLESKWPKDTNKNIVSLDNLKTVLQNINAINCLVEGGGKLQKSFLEQELVNEIVIFRAGKVFGQYGYKWTIPDNVNLTLIESKIIYDEESKENNIMERYLVNYNQNKNKYTDTYVLSDINLAIDQFKKGGFVLVLDDENRENEGDLIVAASKITETQMTELINQTTGIICVPLERSRAKKLNLPLMCLENTDTHKTAFTVSVDHISTGTGVSSQDRLKTVKALANEELIPSDLRRPGHIYPLIANDLGLKERKGHTEAAIALCKLAGIYPRVAVIGELQGRDGLMKKRQACYHYAYENNIPMITVEQLVSAIEKFEDPEFLADCNIATKIGSSAWKMMCFGNHHKPHKVFVYPSSGLSDNVIPIRIHSECFTGDVFKSEHCDCGEQLELAMKYIVANGEGVIIFPSDHEGRGIGIVHKVKAYKLQKEEGLNTFEANKALNLDIDARTYDEIKGILLQLDIKKVELLTENPNKIISLDNLIIKTTPLMTDKNEHNSNYLETKAEHFKEINNTLVKEHNPIIDLTGIDTKSLKVALIYSMWHSHYITQIRDQLKGYLNDLGVTQISEFDVPGSNEIPFKASKIAKDYDGIICIGILIKGDTLHFENVSTAVSNGIMQAQISTGKPMMNCVLSCLNMEQVVARVTGDKSTLEYIARSLVKMTV